LINFSKKEKGIIIIVIILVIFGSISLWQTPGLMEELTQIFGELLVYTIYLFAFVGMIIFALVVFTGDSLSIEAYALIGFLEWLFTLLFSSFHFKKQTSKDGSTWATELTTEADNNGDISDSEYKPIL
jgi:hypothetical protein